MPTQKECNDYQAEIYRSISCRVKFKVFMAAVVAVASVVGIAGPIIWNTAAAASDNSTILYVQEKARDREYNRLVDAIEKLDTKIDKLIDRVYGGSMGGKN